jgi:hypothetical protein
MIRIGSHSASDKWDILCQSWADPRSMADTIVDKWNAPALPTWQDLALQGGRYACTAFINERLSSLGRNAARPPATGWRAGWLGWLAVWLRTRGGPINRDIAQLARRLGGDGLQERVRRLGPAIAKAGFLAPFDEGLSPRLVDALRELFKAGAISLLRWADMRGEVPSIAVVHTRKNRFPIDAIRNKKRVLSIFSALNYGRSDVIHIHDVGPEHVTLVDKNAECLEDMRLIYPGGWAYVWADYEEFLGRQAAECEQPYDLIVADPPLTLLAQVAWDSLPAIMSLCSDTFITFYTTAMCDQLGVAPDDLAGLSRSVKAKTGVDVAFTQMMERNSAAFWYVMCKR